MQATAYIPGMRVLDPSGHSQLCLTGGTSAGSTPSWNDSGGVTLDGSSTPQQLTWQDLGILNMAPVVLQTPYQLPGLQPATQVSQMFVSDYPTVADVFDQLATIAEFVWGVSTSGYGLGGVDVSAGMVLLTNWQGVWRASHAFAQGATILDSNGHIQRGHHGRNNSRKGTGVEHHRWLCGRWDGSLDRPGCAVYSLLLSAEHIPDAKSAMGARRTDDGMGRTLRPGGAEE